MQRRQSVRILFASYHCYVDPSNGAALSMRDLLEMLAMRGWDCRVLCGPQVDFESGESVEQLLSDQGIPYRIRRHSSAATGIALLHSEIQGVRLAIYCSPRAVRAQRDEQDGNPFLALYDRLLRRWRPHLILTYGGDWLARELIATAKQLGIPVVMWLRNLAYKDPTHFRYVDAVLVPSGFARAHYARNLGLECTAIPPPINWSRIQCSKIERRYVTFVNPQPSKGVFIFARLAEQLGRRRPEIPLLVVEGRAKSHWLSRTGIDLKQANLHVMANTADPRDFYRVSRLVVMPSVVPETFGRVAAEAMINGIPVLASRRGAMPEVLGAAGVLLDLPEWMTPESRRIPTADEVAPWLDALLRLWDDGRLYEQQSCESLKAADPWHADKLAARYQDFLGGVVGRTPSVE